MSIFGGASAQSRTRNLLEFKAGKMTLRSNMVHPDQRKGLVYVYQGNDTLMHFCWKDRSSNAPHPEDDLVIFPQEVEFKKVTKNTTGRVYILKWRTNARKFFFWMQEPKDDKDDEICKKVNDFLNNPPVPGLGDGGSRANNLQPLLDQLTGSAGGLSPDLTSALQGLNPADLASLFSSMGQGMGGHLQERSNRQSGDSRPNTAPALTRSVPMSSSTSAAAATTRATATSSRARESVGSSSASSTTNPPSANKPKTAGNIQMSALTNVLSTLSNTSTETRTTTTSEPTPTVDLNEIFSPESLIPLLSNKNVQEKLRPHLPEGYNLPVNENEFRDIISSPQFRQAVSAFSLALQSGQMAPVLTQFQFPTEVIEAANRGDIQAFARELEKHAKNSQSETKSNDPSMDTN